jgi:hypothetical protein
MADRRRHRLDCGAVVFGGASSVRDWVADQLAAILAPTARMIAVEVARQLHLTATTVILERSAQTPSFRAGLAHPFDFDRQTW